MLNYTCQGRGIANHRASCYSILLVHYQFHMVPPSRAEKGDYNMYIAKLYSNAATPVSIISYASSKNILDVKRYAISVASDFDIPGYDAIHKIEIYADEYLIDTIVL